jgi:hypothetical protein
VIKLRYSSVDGCGKQKSFKSLKGARKYAQEMVGKNPEMGSRYAVSGDGIGKIVVIEGAALAELFGDLPVKQAEPDVQNDDGDL